MDDLLSLEEATRTLGVSKPTLYRLLAQGALPGTKVGKQWRFRRADLDAYLERGVAGGADVLPTAPPDLLAAEIFFFAEELDSAGQEPAEPENAEEPAVNLFALIASYAVQTRASDIHLEAGAGGTLRLRLRYEGRLRIIREMPAALRPALIAAVKERMGMNPSESKLPQEGRTRIPIGGRDFELRASSVPVVGGGESVVLRLIDRNQSRLGIDDLGLSVADRARLEDWIAQPSGLVLIGGPVGSGKTALLYALLAPLAADTARKVVTVEEPVEYRLEGATQIPVGPKTGMPFGAALRVAARQDPDILASGAVPGEAAGHLLAEMATLGHLVLAVFGGGGIRRAAEAPTRLIERGLEPFLVTSALIGAISCRLARRLCVDCKEPLPEGDPARERLRRLAATAGSPLPEGEGVVYYRGRGCANCRQSGYRGRIGLFELLPFTPSIADAVLAGAGPDEIETAAADEEGMTTLLADGLSKAAAGLTTVDEVLRVSITTL